MIRGIYSGAAGMNVLQEKMNVMANNLANVNTNGFKMDQAVVKSFNEQLINLIDTGKDIRKLRPIGNFCHGVTVDEINTYFTQGVFQQTGHDTDLALDGEGFFRVSGAEGDYYTRDGAFSLDNEGYLVTSRGYTLMGQNGPVMTEPGKNLKIGSDGKIYLDGVEQDTLDIKNFDDLQKLKKEGDNFFRVENEADAGVYDATNFTLKQGFLEKSNVELVNEMTDIIAVSRAYETSQKLMQVQDELLGKAVNNIGTIK
ncbi:flagellar basal-body rod protein FlgF [Desulfofarcimen acetoxidans DSM 771]|uniref:Flagellar basal-body rod protein FlgF n=1 Tax=Desulfofarcimen acetoxidans (strain ATCC 49208 / DSM 771 / KCTC 5769 / VKM B-1644 / 5575) TaxID=485916 RepID=C8W1H9_DESAS|nr:flagellar basal-body rod protein FlgF [Desulfofarcimen acetoxidans]ACV61624.1 flagellar basal-body rod protein FlgF [Desulfofarcimen acetoxidans DSM 771]